MFPRTFNEPPILDIWNIFKLYCKLVGQSIVLPSWGREMGSTTSGTSSSGYHSNTRSSVVWDTGQPILQRISVNENSRLSMLRWQFCSSNGYWENFIEQERSRVSLQVWYVHSWLPLHEGWKANKDDNMKDKIVFYFCRCDVVLNNISDGLWQGGIEVGARNEWFGRAIREGYGSEVEARRGRG